MELAALLRGEAGLQAYLAAGLEGDIRPGGNGYPRSRGNGVGCLIPALPGSYLPAPPLATIFQ
ncbi:MAG: hypothetical protein D6748_14405 [Calditrichaeota bacterium]|nr:MAG: hypothetical protein D6748_14405 [Calditrichota bacterium]